MIPTEFINLADQIRESSEELHLIRGLTPARFDGICLLLQGHASTLRAFRNSVEDFIGQGYQMTSLVAEIRCSSEQGTAKNWQCKVRPKIGAKPATPKPLKGAQRHGVCRSTAEHPR